MRYGENAVRTPIFIHSSFRTSSTWMWSLFRDVPGVCAYYEIFNESLAHLDAKGVQTTRPDAWASNHPPSRPYFLEFIPFLQPNGGVSLFDKRLAFEAFIPDGGVQAAISQEEYDYVDSLIKAASLQGKAPVLTCTRTLGRINGLRAAFSGIHVVIYRNLYHQWLSYCSLSTKGQHYFLKTTYLIVVHNLRDPFFAFLYSNYLRPAEQMVLDGDQTLEIDRRAFEIFFGVHLYLYLNAMPTADIVLNVNRLAREAPYRNEVAREIEAATGLQVDLGSVSERLEYFDSRLGDLHTLRKDLAHILSKAVESCMPERRPSELQTLGHQLLDETMEEIERSTLYLDAARAYFGEGASEELAKAKIENEKLTRRLQNLSDALEREVHARESAMHERDALLSSTSWKVTAPLRALGGFLESGGQRTS